MPFHAINHGVAVFGADFRSSLDGIFRIGGRQVLRLVKFIGSGDGRAAAERRRASWHVVTFAYGWRKLRAMDVDGKRITIAYLHSVFNAALGLPFGVVGSDVMNR